MVYARIQIARPPQGEGEAIPSSPQQIHGQGHQHHQHHGSSRLNGRLSVLDASVEQAAFDTVQLRFRGIILSSVGFNSAIEDIITLTDVKALSDFRPTTSSSNSSRTDSEKARHVDFYFQLPTNVSATDGTSRSLPLSTTIRGVTSASPRGGLNDYQVIRGDCEVSYWVEAQFRQAGREVGFLCEHVKISSLYPRLRVSLAKSLPLTMRAKPDLLARCRLQKSPALDVALYEPDIIIEHDATSGQRQITLPIAVTMDIQPPASGADSLDARQSFKCSVEAKWEVHTRFSTVAISTADRMPPGDTIYKMNTAPTQKHIILFRPLPLYDDQVSPGEKFRRLNSYVATSQLDLSVPDALSQPSLRWKHLTRTYMLQLSLHFHGLRGTPRYSLCKQIPLSVSADESKVGEVQKNEAIVSISEANNIPDVEGDVHDMTTLRHIRTQSTRTPPPPYFR
ncbi:hypothetical protein A1O3_02835 [Capronia epimyces CBS 606.96]|uniref:Arrestin-like N-terminal domain-containing protein n=1 Tax=Capronia epimyces CBS 606.96 TaxID=1182542 RepID=W9YB66_9EURO|nr:uncharacterized protein A1O3_02835 [Capronia epimyces CBS 606.96]EXJ89768.1 hypothetical protein A1O3_02835 [Capronia epimyces CBS 606.96]